MAVAISAALVGSTVPQAVQVQVSGLTSGDEYSVTGSWSGGSWPVRGGVGTADGSLLVLTDYATPVNIPITYSVTVDAASTESSAVTVPHARNYLLSSLDGRSTAAFRMLVDGLARSRAMRSVQFDIPGRTDPVVIFDVPAADSGDLTALCDDVQSAALDDLLDLGGLTLLRTNGTVADLPAAAFLLMQAASSQRIGPGLRQWSLGYRIMGDPEPDTAVSASTWDDVKTAYAGLTYADLKAEWAGQTYDDFRTYDWASRVDA